MSLLLMRISALGQVMLYVDGMNGVISHIGTIQWLYTICGAKVTYSLQAVIFFYQDV